MKRRMARVLAMVMAVVLMGTSTNVTAFAARICDHHLEHTAGCGYVEAVEGADCTHEHDEECYSEVEVCVHEHDENCGYVQAVEGRPCSFVCNVCDAEASDEDDEDAVCICEDKCTADAVNEECPVCSLEEADLALCAGEEAEDEEVTCICTDKCMEDSVNEECPVCAAENADLNNCIGEATEEKIITAWSFIDEYECIDLETNTLALPGASAENVALKSDVISLLPTSIVATVNETEENITLSGWECEDYPETGAYAGTYTFTATLPVGYTLGEEVSELTVNVELGGAGLYDEEQTTGDFTVIGGTYGQDYTYDNEAGLLTIQSSKEITIANVNPSTSTTDRIEVADGVSANITLAGVNIDVSSQSDTAAFKIADNSTGNVTITLADGTTNTLKSGDNCAGLQKNGEYSETLGKLTITGTGTLTATGGEYGAGMGGGDSCDGSNSGAGIGGGSSSNIEISGGTVTATGGENGAGIGGGGSDSGQAVGCNIKISGGTVTATGGAYGAGIGGGYEGNGSNIEISGGKVTATGGAYGAGIGSGDSGSGSYITISGGEVTATGGEEAAGIGGGWNGSGSYITISGGSVKAVAGEGFKYLGTTYFPAAIGQGVQYDGVYSNGAEVTPTDGNGNNVYLLDLDVDDTSAVTANGKAYPTKHFDENKVYIYLPAKTAQAPNEVTVGNETTKYCYDTTDQKWVTVIDIPEEPEETTFTYDGEAKTYVLLVNDTYYTITRNVQTNAGNYTVTVSLKDKENTVWSDGTTEDKEYSFVINKADSVLKTLPTPKTGLTYNGEGQNLISAGTATGGTMQYSLNCESWSPDIPSAIDAGEYTVYYKIAGNENYNGSEADSFTVNIAKKQLTVTGVAATSRDYIANDKTVDITGITLSGIQGTDDDVSVKITGLKGTLSSANAGTYTSVTLPTLTLTGDDADNYVLVQPTSAVATNVTINKLNPTITVGATEYYKTFGDADFTLNITDDNPEANVTYSSDDENVVTVSNGTVTIKGAGPATITVSMGASTNYNAAVDKTVTVNVAKAAYSVDTINKNYLYAISNDDSINLAELLPEDCGNVTYASVTSNGALRFISEPKVTNGILAYTLESGAADDTGNIIVDVETQNYEDITITVNVTLIDKIPVNVDGEVELNSNILTYGETLSGLTFKSVDFVDNAGNEVEGTLAWKEPSATPNAGTTSATWVFTPNNAEYASVEGTVAITVNKATPNVTAVPTVNVIQYHPSGKLNSVALLGGTVTGVEDNTLAGTWKWKNADTTPIVNNDGYVAVFTPQDDMNYEAIEETVEVPVRKAEASLTIEEGKTFYDKSFTADDFELTGISHTGDSTLTYTVKDEKTIDGEEKEAGSVITVSDDGIVSVIGTGSANIYVGVSESDNYLAVTPQIITVNVGLEDGFFVEGEKEYIYTGKAIKPAFIVYDGLNGELVAKKDYTISYKNNTKAYTLKEDEEGFDAKKAPQAVIKGKGAYGANMTVYFTILPKDISKLEDESIVVKDILLEENGKVQKKVPSITYNGKKLAGVLKPENGSTPAKVKDFVYSYVYSYPNMTEEEIADNAFKSAGSWKILVEGTGNYTGERYVDVVIATKGGKMSSAKIKSIPTQEYTGEAIELAADELQVTAKINGKTTILERGIHYDVLRYKNNTEIGTATVILTGIPKNGFSGSKTATFKIVGSSIAKASVTGIESKVYSGNAQTQDVAVTLSKKVQTENGTKTQTVTLIKDKDYTVSYDKNVNVGTAKMTIKGMGAYTGTIKKTFKITAYDMKGETDAAGNAKKDSPLSETNGLFTMKNGEFSVKYVKGGAKPAVKLIFNGKPLTEGKDYTLSYKNNANVYTLKEGEEGYKANKAPVLTIKGKGNFKGSVSKTFIITGRSLTEEGMAVTMTVADKAVSTKNGGYISKPILTDKDGKVLKQGKDYTAPVYTMKDEEGKTTILSEKAKVTTPGSVITVTVEGIGAYAGTKEDSVITGTYRITEKNFTGIKAASISKPYTGSKVTLTEEDFYIVDNEGKKTSKITIGSGKNKKELQYGVDFEIVPGSYKNNIKKGTASVTLRGKGTYGGTKTIKFKVGTRGFGDWNWWGFGLGE